MRHQGAITITQRSYTMGWKIFLIRIHIFLYISPPVFFKIYSQRVQSTNIEEKSWKKFKICCLAFPFLSVKRIFLIQRVLAFRDFTISDPPYFVIYSQALISWKGWKKWKIYCNLRNYFTTLLARKRGEREYHALLINITCWWASM